MQKKRIVLFAVAILVLMVSTFMLFACNKDAPHSMNLDEGSYPDMFASNFQGSELAAVNAGLQNGATADQVKAAVLAMYNVANRSRRTADTSLMVQDTNAGNGFMLFKGYELKSGDAWYYQLPTQAPGILNSLISYTTLAYTIDSDTFYFAHLGPKSKPNCQGIDTFPYATFELVQEPEAYNFDGYKEVRFFLDDQLELCNMKMSLDLLFVDNEAEQSSSISYDAENRVYKVKLVIDCRVEGTDEEKAAKKAKMREWYLQAFNEGNTYAPFDAKCTERTYEYWYAEFEVWDNGYVKSLTYTEKWDSDNSMVNSDAVSNFKFFYYDDEIMTIVKQDPRYTALDEETQAEFTSPLSFVEFYNNAEISKNAGGLLDWEIALIAVGCAIFAVIVIVVPIVVVKNKKKKANAALVSEDEPSEADLTEDDVPFEEADEPKTPDEE